jgi:hypothetical protein
MKRRDLFFYLADQKQSKGSHMNVSFIVGPNGIQNYVLDGKAVAATTAPAPDTKRAAAQRFTLAMRAQGELNRARRDFMAGKCTGDDLSVLAAVATQRWRDADDPRLAKVSPALRSMFLDSIGLPQESGAR